MEEVPETYRGGESQSGLGQAESQVCQGPERDREHGMCPTMRLDK